MKQEYNDQNHYTITQKINSESVENKFVKRRKNLHSILYNFRLPVLGESSTKAQSPEVDSTL